MPSKKDVEKRRVTAQQAAEAKERAASTRSRKRTMTVGLLAGFLAIMMVLPLAAGLIAIFDDGDDSVDPVDLPDTPAALRPTSPGRALTGDTPCPATDGTEERTTSFETAPGLCINPELDYEVTLTTDVGDVTITVEPDLDVDAANLFVTNARYGVYDDVPFHVVIPEGLTVTGDPGPGDAGFRVDTQVADVDYEVGTVVMYADNSNRVGSQFAFVATPLIAELFAADQVHPAIGGVTAGQGSIDTVIAVAGSADTTPLPTADIRIQTVTVAEVG